MISKLEWRGLGDADSRQPTTLEVGLIFMNGFAFQDFVFLNHDFVPACIRMHPDCYWMVLE